MLSGLFLPRGAKCGAVCASIADVGVAETCHEHRNDNKRGERR